MDPSSTPEPTYCRGEECEWRKEALALRVLVRELEEKLAALERIVEGLQRRLFCPKTEKMPSTGKEIRSRKPPSEDAEERRLAGLQRRRDRAAMRRKMQEQTIRHPVSEEQKRCPSCGGLADRPVGEGKKTVQYEYVPGYFVRQSHVQETVACSCGSHIVTAEPPPKPFERGHYGPGFVAHLVTMKCADSIPLHRLAKQYQRLGIPMSRSTLTDLFHAASERALRVVALGRKNFLFVFDEDKGANLAGLYSLVSTCELHEIDPVVYLKDVLLRIDTHPNSKIDDLLPDRWKPPPGSNADQASA
jgi:transposase